MPTSLRSRDATRRPRRRTYLVSVQRSELRIAAAILSQRGGTARRLKSLKTECPMSNDQDNQLITERREKLQALRRECEARGTVPFPNDFKPRHHAGDLHHKHGQVPNEELEPQAVAVSVAGRMMLKRVMGKACFATLQDG